jgi:hypothetical protein
MASWNAEEDKILKEFYERAPREDILSRLPGKNWRSAYRRSYDGGGHDISMKVKGGLTQEEFIKSERKRELFIKSRGFSIIRIISKDDLLPKDEIILKMISEAKEYLKTGHSWITFDIDNKKVICSQSQSDYNFGELRKLPD